LKVDDFLSRLEKVKATQNGHWIARCPAHADKHPSMTVRETPEGIVLVHCFAGCDVESILSAVGMDFDALFPDKPLENATKPIRRPFPAADVLEALADESRLIALAAANVRSGVTLSDADYQRLMVAAERIQVARNYALGE
jgi:hypothetical protein